MIVRRWVRFLKKHSYGTGLVGCNSWTLDEAFAKTFADEAAAREWLAGTPAEIVPAAGQEDAPPPAAQPC